MMSLHYCDIKMTSLWLYDVIIPQLIHFDKAGGVLTDLALDSDFYQNRRFILSAAVPENIPDSMRNKQ